jgi:cysteine desulfurase
MPVYLDHAATTPVDKRVLTAMEPYFLDHAANPHASHQHGRAARKAVEQARASIADILVCDPGELVFTSGGTESNNAALRGILHNPKHSDPSGILITSPIEHHAILSTAEYLEQWGVEVRYLPVTESGRIRPEDLEAELQSLPDSTDRPVLVSLMHTNNEIGSVNPIAELAEVAHQHDALFHTDAVQSTGKLPLDLSALNVDLLSVSAHKLYGPKGVGLLYIRDGVHPQPFILGGSQERNRRGGTLNVPGIVGMAKAFELTSSQQNQLLDKIHKFKMTLWQGIKEVNDIQANVNGPDPEADIQKANPYILNIRFTYPNDKPLNGSLTLMQLDLDGVSVSSGSACTAGTLEASHVLKSLGLSEDEAKSSIRFSFGKDNTQEDIDLTINILRNILPVDP